MVEHISPNKTTLGAALLCLCALLSGCGGSIGANRGVTPYFQKFYDPARSRIAVLPFQNNTYELGLGQRISNQVSSILANSGAYEVYSRNELADLMQEVELVDSGIITGDSAREIGRLASLHYLVTGSCDRYETDQREEIRQRQTPRRGRDAQGRRRVVGYEDVSYIWQRYEAYVECNVKVIDTSSGRQVAEFYEPVLLSSMGSPPHRSLDYLLRQAEAELVSRIAQGLVPPAGYHTPGAIQPPPTQSQHY